MDLITAGAVLTIINTFLRPLLTLFLGPFIILTFGLLLIVINAATLYLLDILIANLTIQGLVPLLLATLIVGLTNTFVHLTARSAYRK
jgi:putative membrane protein